MEQLSQRDPRWANFKINGTAYTLGTDGCLITCLAMMAGLHPDEVADKIGFTGAQVAWTGLDKIGLELVDKFNPYDNDKVTQYIADYGSCIVKVDWDGSPKSTADVHFVLFVGNHQLIDPWDGKLKPTSAYPLLTGYRAVKKVSQSNMAELPANYPDIIHNSTQWDIVCQTQGLGESKSAGADTLNATIAGYKSRITDLGNQLGVAQTEVGNREEQVKRLNDEIARVNGNLKTATDQLNDFKTKYEEAMKAKGEINNQLGVANQTIETLKQQQQQGQVSLTLGDLLKLLWNQKIVITK